MRLEAILNIFFPIEVSQEEFSKTAIRTDPVEKFIIPPTEIMATFTGPAPTIYEHHVGYNAKGRKIYYDMEYRMTPVPIRKP